MGGADPMDLPPGLFLSLCFRERQALPVFT